MPQCAYDTQPRPHTVERPALPPPVAAAARAAVSVAASCGVSSCVALVGSWANGRATASSDVDLVLLVPEPDALLRTSDWFTAFGAGAQLVRSADFGALQERRLRLPHGLVVEVDVGRLDWACTSPVDHGTRHVVEDGCVPLLDPAGRLAEFLRVVRRTRERAYRTSMLRAGDVPVRASASAAVRAEKVCRPRPLKILRTV